MSNFASGYIKYINHLEQINAAALEAPEEMIAQVEGAYREVLENIARNICQKHRKVRIVMLAGPSASGKTTTARLLKGYLEDYGVRAHTVSLDDFYRGAGLAPLLPNGKFDYEAVEALDVGRVQETLRAAAAGEPFSLPRYAFELGQSVETDTLCQVGPDELALVEGIHALNPAFTGGLPGDAVLKLYVSVKQQIKDANGEVISPMDLRLVRRIVRDIRFRKTSAEGTLSMWDEVIRGEDLYIRPYRMQADYTVNSIHIYEPCVLRTLAIPLLRQIAPDSLYYRRARDLESRLMRFEPISADRVPEGSMLREFLGSDEELTDF